MAVIIIGCIIAGIVVIFVLYSCVYCAGRADRRMTCIRKNAKKTGEHDREFSSGKTIKML